MWPGNTTDVKTLIPVTDRVRKRFGINRLCIVADRGMISAETIKELERRLNQAGHLFEWSDIKQDLKALQQVTIEEDGKYFAIRSECKGHCGKIFQAVKVAVPPTIREAT